MLSLKSPRHTPTLPESGQPTISQDFPIFGLNPREQNSCRACENSGRAQISSLGGQLFAIFPALKALRPRNSSRLEAATKFSHGLQHISKQRVWPEKGRVERNTQKATVRFSCDFCVGGMVLCVRLSDLGAVLQPAERGSMANRPKRFFWQSAEASPRGFRIARNTGRNSLQRIESAIAFRYLVPMRACLVRRQDQRVPGQRDQMAVRPIARNFSGANLQRNRCKHTCLLRRCPVAFAKTAKRRPIKPKYSRQFCGIGHVLRELAGTRQRAVFGGL